jgi:hypothetical protein
VTQAEINDADYLRELKVIEAESMGWLRLDNNAYLHLGTQPGRAQDAVIEVVGIMTDASMADANVLWLVF